MNPEDQEAKGIRSLVEAGSAITGSAAGAGIGFLLGGPAGAVVGGACTPLLQRGIIKIGNDIAERFLSEREKIRIGGVIYYATIRIQENLAAGKMVRNDGFFQKTTECSGACAEIPFVDRPSAEEVLEGILLVAQREFEERKIAFLGNLIANIAFDDKIARLQANQLIKKAADISYRQMCLISLFVQSKDFELRNKAYFNEKLPVATFTLLQEIYDMASQGLVTLSPIVLRSIADITPQKMRVEGIGRLLYDLMELKDIERTDLESLVQLLQ